MKIRTIVVHYTATYPEANPTVAEIDKWHKEAGSREFGYHWYIDRLGRLFEGRPENTMGAHVRGHNADTLGVCWAGGLERATGPNVGVWNITNEQEAQLIRLIKDIQKRHPTATNVVGHRNLVATECPGRDDVAAWWASVTKDVTVVKELNPSSFWQRFINWLKGK